MWLDWLVFCVYGFSVSALWCPLATPTILFGFLLPWTWGLSSWLLQQSAAPAPYLGWGVSPHRHPFRPWTWNSSSRHPGARAATAPPVSGKCFHVESCSHHWIQLPCFPSFRGHNPVLPSCMVSRNSCFINFVQFTNCLLWKASLVSVILSWSEMEMQRFF